MWEINFFPIFHHFIGLLPSFNIPLFGCSYQQHPCLVININHGSSLALWWRKTTDSVWKCLVTNRVERGLRIAQILHFEGHLRSPVKFSDMFVILTCQDCSSGVYNSWHYPELFVGTKKNVQIHVDETFKPTARRSRQTPFHLRT